MGSIVGHDVEGGKKNVVTSRMILGRVLVELQKEINKDAKKNYMNGLRQHSDGGKPFWAPVQA